MQLISKYLSNEEVKMMKYLIVFIAIFSIFISGCSNEIAPEESKIVVQKRIGQEDQYELFKEVTDNNIVQEATDLLEHASWEEGVVLMTRPPDYTFQFEISNQPENSNYDLWISPDHDQVELVIEDQEKYIQLDRVDSVELYEFITGSKLEKNK